MSIRPLLASWLPGEADARLRCGLWRGLGNAVPMIGPASRRLRVPGYSAVARISDSASVTRARMLERIVSRPAHTALVAFEMEVSCDLS